MLIVVHRYKKAIGPLVCNGPIYYNEFIPWHQKYYMRAAMGGPSFLFRFVIASLTAFLIIMVMSLAQSLVVSAAGGATATGGFFQASASPATFYMLLEIGVGVITFFWTFFVLSTRKDAKKK